MKKTIFTVSLIIILIPIIIFNIINITITQKIKINNQITTIINNTLPSPNLITIYEYPIKLPTIQINNKDYLGLLSIPKTNLLLPIESNCSNNLTITSACLYTSTPLIILGTTQKDSFPSFNHYTIGDTINLTNTLGQILQTKIEKITRVTSLNDLSKYNESLIIILKNYYDMNYILFICHAY